MSGRAWFYGLLFGAASWAVIISLAVLGWWLLVAG